MSITNGELGSSVRSKLNTLFPIQPVINITGTSPVYPPLIVIPPVGLKFGAIYIEPSGSWVEGFSIEADAESALLTLEFANLAGIKKDCEIGNHQGLTSLLFPALKTVVGDIKWDAMPVLETIDLTALVYCNSIQFDALDLLVELNCPLLEHIGAGFAPSVDLPALTTIRLPSIISVGNGIRLQSNTGAVTDFTIGSSLKSVGADGVVLNSCALNEASVDNILVRLAALDGTAGTTSFDNNTVTIAGTSAPPSATGLAAKATLEGRGNTVTVNS